MANSAGIQRRAFVQTLLAGVAVSALMPKAAVAEAVMGRLPDENQALTGPRARLLIDRDWRFHMGDPEGVGESLVYEVRRGEGWTEGQPEEWTPRGPDVKIQAGGLKPWILPTANSFIKDATKRHARPEGHPGGDIAFVQAGFDDAAWRRLNLPHDWAIEGAFLKDGPYSNIGRLKSWGPVWYRKRLDIPARDKGKTVYLDVDGAMSYATVWINGKLAGGWPYGYNGWRVDLTPYLVPGGENQLAIRLDNPIDSSRWYTGAGLYRHVWLTKVDPIHVAHWGTYVRTPVVSADAATIELDVTVTNSGAATTSVAVVTDIFALDSDGKRAGKAVARIDKATASVASGGTATIKGSVTLTNPRLWGPAPDQTPHRYVAVTAVSKGSKVVDRYETRFGIRSLEFNPDKGVLVNGVPVRLKGVNLHHDLGSLGAAFNYRAAERQLEVMAEMGCNALRCAHNPPATEVLEICDRLGILVVDEIFDAWERKKTNRDSHLLFADWSEPDLRALMRRDRNHPSVFMWSVGNEILEQQDGEKGAEVARRLVAIAHDEDPTRPATAGLHLAKAWDPITAEFDTIGVNYQGAGTRTHPGRYPEYKEKFPTKLIYGSETVSTLSSRGEYIFPVPGGYFGHQIRPGIGADYERRHVSAYELFATDPGVTPDRQFMTDERHPYVAGEFIWTGWDYLGEPTPFKESRSAYFGCVDLAGFKKDRFWLYQSQWRPDLPMAHILPHWTWPERVGQVTPVHVFSSGDEAELFVNGKSQGKVPKRTARSPYEYRFRWDYVVYEPGEVSVVVYKGGKEWARDSVRTAGAAQKLEAIPDRARIRADGSDLSFVAVRVVDSEGHLSPRAMNRVRFSIDGPGEILTTDNGDQTSFEPFQAHEKPAFNGLVMAVVRSQYGQAGTIRVRAEAEGLAPVTVKVESK